jgi:hypothetical protein
MFTRFTSSARAVVVAARGRALDADVAEFGEEHLLAALLNAPGVRRLLEQLGVNGDGRAMADVGEAQRRGGRRSRLKMSAGSALASQAGLRQAAARGDRELREEHLLLGLIARPSPVTDALGLRGVTTATVLAALAALDAKADPGRASLRVLFSRAAGDVPTLLRRAPPRRCRRGCRPRRTPRRRPRVPAEVRPRPERAPPGRGDPPGTAARRRPSG